MKNKPLTDAEEIIKNYRILEKTNNVMVINLPPDKNGRLVDEDVQNLNLIAKKLGINRK